MNTSPEQTSQEALSRLAEELTDIAERSQRLIADFTENADKLNAGETQQEFMLIGQTFMQYAMKLAENPIQMIEAQADLWAQYSTLWQNTLQRMTGNEAEPVASPDAGDRRFKDAEWSNNIIFDYIKQSYLLTSRWLVDQTGHAEGLEPHLAKKVDFFTRQFVDAISPTNFVATNPTVLKETLETRGENLLKGLQNILSDMERGHGQLRISQTDMDAFSVGENIAVTPGQVVFENELMQLIHYEPTTETQFETPLLIIPPWINKFYILDLRPENSFIKWATDQGHSVYVISWINPTEELRHKDFTSYMMDGPLAALEAIKTDIGIQKVNAIGYCLGGTLLSATLAYAAKKNMDSFASATFFTTLVDFEKAGELSVFVDEDQIQAIERKMREKGFLDGAEMASTFNSLRSNDLIWSFVVSNYLMGKEPFPFDLLFWNSDSTRLPEAMHSFYLRNMYQKNLMREPGGISMANVPINLGDIDVPTYFLATKEDHIAPWPGVYQGMKRFGGESKFVLAASGHIAGVINPPAAEKYSYWTNEQKLDEQGDWLESSVEKPGSWWIDWQSWVLSNTGQQVPARIPGKGKLSRIEAAPGSYVKVRS
ncbi:MAG: class I poly(R)-hydroxyalkanoic acid synthase [Rhodospirillales bacterium]|jgi:polyhydroxyalkanoate synthase